MLYWWMWTLGKSRRNGCGHSKTSLWVPGWGDSWNRVWERTNRIFAAYVQSVAETISTPCQGPFVNPCGWGTKDSTKCTVYVFPGQGATLKDHFMQFKDHWVFFNISVLKYIIYTRRSSLFIFSVVFVSSWVCGSVQRQSWYNEYLEHVFINLDIKGKFLKEQ